MSTDAELDRRLRAADAVGDAVLPTLPAGFLHHVQRLHEPAGPRTSRQREDDAHAARQQRRSRHRRRSAVLLTAAAAVTAGLVVGLSPDSTPSAFADYDATPTAVTAAQAQEQAEACRSFLLQFPTTDIGGAAPTVTERRGSWEFTVLVGVEQEHSCLLQETATGRKGYAGGGGLQPWEDDGTAAVTVETRTSTQSVDGRDLVDAWGSAVGRAGADVTAVDLVFPDGQTVHATLSGTWWAAWWPGQVDEDMQGGPTTVRYTTADNRTRERPY